MLLCKEQKREFIINGRIIRVSDKAANAHYKYCNLPITEDTVQMYLETYRLGTPLEKILNTYTDVELSEIITQGVKQELVSVSDESEWDSVPEIARIWTIKSMPVSRKHTKEPDITSRRKNLYKKSIKKCSNIPEKMLE